MVRTQAALLFVLALVHGCHLHIGEPRPSQGVYSVENLTTTRLVVEATGPWGHSLELSNSEIEVGEVLEIHNQVNDADLSPSNAFGSLQIYGLTVSDETLIYEGIHNEDWVMEGVDSSGDGFPRHLYVLSITEPPES